MHTGARRPISFCPPARTPWWTRIPPHGRRMEIPAERDLRRLTAALYPSMTMRKAESTCRSRSKTHPGALLESEGSLHKHFRPSSSPGTAFVHSAPAHASNIPSPVMALNGRGMNFPLWAMLWGPHPSPLNIPGAKDGQIWARPCSKNAGAPAKLKIANLVRRRRQALSALSRHRYCDIEDVRPKRRKERWKRVSS